MADSCWYLGWRFEPKELLSFNALSVTQGHPKSECAVNREEQDGRAGSYHTANCSHGSVASVSPLESFPRLWSSFHSSVVQEPLIHSGVVWSTLQHCGHTLVFPCDTASFMDMAKVGFGFAACGFISCSTLLSVKPC